MLFRKVGQCLGQIICQLILFLLWHCSSKIRYMISLFLLPWTEQFINAGLISWDDFRIKKLPGCQ